MPWETVAQAVLAAFGGHIPLTQVDISKCTAAEVTYGCMSYFPWLISQYDKDSSVWVLGDYSHWIKADYCQVYHVDPVNYLRDIQIIPDGFYVPLSSVSAMDNAGKLRRLQYRGSPDDQWYTFLSHDRLFACLAVLIWAMILGMFVVHPKLTMNRLGHRVFVGNGGVLTGGTDVNTIQPLVTVGDGVLMGQEPTVIEACFAAGLQVIADLTQMGAFTPARAEIAMCAAFDRSDSPTAPDELPSVADAVITSLACLAEQIVWLRMEVEQDQLNAA